MTKLDLLIYALDGICKRIDEEEKIKEKSYRTLGETDKLAEFRLKKLNKDFDEIAKLIAEE